MSRSPEPAPSSEADTLDRKFLASLLESGAENVAIETNPGFTSLETKLLSGRPGSLTIGFSAGEAASKGDGVVSGGTQAAMLDSAIALAVLSVLAPGQTCATITLTVNMMRSAPLGTLTARAKVDRIGRRVAFASAELFDAADRCVSSATSSLAVVNLASVG